MHNDIEDMFERIVNIDILELRYVVIDIELQIHVTMSDFRLFTLRLYYGNIYTYLSQYSMHLGLPKQI